MDHFYNPDNRWEKDYGSFFFAYSCSGTRQSQYTTKEELVSLGKPVYRFTSCPHCDGTGRVEEWIIDATKVGLPALPSHKVWCRICNGTGSVVVPKNN